MGVKAKGLAADSELSLPVSSLDATENARNSCSTLQQQLSPPDSLEGYYTCHCLSGRGGRARIKGGPLDILSRILPPTKRLSGALSPTIPSGRHNVQVSLNWAASFNLNMRKLQHPMAEINAFSHHLLEL